MGVGVSRVTSIAAFDDLWRRAILFFSFLSSCLAWSAFPQQIYRSVLQLTQIRARL